MVKLEDDPASKRLSMGEGVLSTQIALSMVSLTE